MSDSVLVAQTIAWIKSVVIGCNFCPFASKALQGQSIRFVIQEDAAVEKILEAVVSEFQFLDKHTDTETTLIILAKGFEDFMRYLDLVELAEKLCAVQGYEGTYQIASFHPEYLFAGTDHDDPSNYTNRSVYPMLHILREESVTRAVEQHPDAEGIPNRNIEFARLKGLEYMVLLRNTCLEK